MQIFLTKSLPNQITPGSRNSCKIGDNCKIYIIFEGLIAAGGNNFELRFSQFVTQVNTLLPPKLTKSARKGQKNIAFTRIFIRNLPQGLVPKIP